MHVLLSNYSLHVLVGWGYCVPGPVLKPVFGTFFEIPERMVAVLVSVVSSAATIHSRGCLDCPERLQSYKATIHC